MHEIFSTGRNQQSINQSIESQIRRPLQSMPFVSLWIRSSLYDDWSCSLRRLQKSYKIIFIAPACPKQAWFSDLLRLSCYRFLLLPPRRDLPEFREKSLHQYQEKSHLHAGLVSVKIKLNKKGLVEKSSKAYPLDHAVRESITILFGAKMDNFFLTWVLRGKFIISKSLSCI